MKYELKITDKILKKLNKIHKKDKERIIESIDSLVEDPRPTGCKKLKGLEGIYRVRSGNYRVVYSVQDDVLVVIVVEIGHRKDIYK